MLITFKTRAESTNPMLQHLRMHSVHGRWSSVLTCTTSSFPSKPEDINSLTTILLMTDKTGKKPFSLSYFKILAKDSNAYLQFIPAGSRLFCTGCTGRTKPLFQIVYTDCMAYWNTKKKKKVLIRDIFHSVTMYCHFSMLIQLCWSAKTRPTQQLSTCCSFFRDITGQSRERWWVWRLFPQCICS